MLWRANCAINGLTLWETESEVRGGKYGTMAQNGYNMAKKHKKNEIKPLYPKKKHQIRPPNGQVWVAAIWVTTALG